MIAGEQIRKCIKDALKNRNELGYIGIHTMYSDEKKHKLLGLYNRYKKSVKKSKSSKYKKELERKYRKQYYLISIS